MFRGVADVSEVWRNLSIRSRGKHLRRCELLETAAKLSAAAKRSCTRKHIDVFAVVETATRELPNVPSPSPLHLPIGLASLLQFLGDKVRSYATPVCMRNCARHARATRLRCLGSPSLRIPSCPATLMDLSLSLSPSPSLPFPISFQYFNKFPKTAMDDLRDSSLPNNDV